MVRDTPNLIHSSLRVVAVALVHFCQRHSSELRVKGHISVLLKTEERGPGTT